MSSIRPPGAGRRRRIRSSSITIGSRKAGTSRHGNNPSSSSQRSARASSRCGPRTEGPASKGLRMSEEIDHDRRRFLGTAAMAIAADQLGVFASADAQASEAKAAGATATKRGTKASFGPLKQIDAGVLNVGYAEAGPPSGSPVILLHGWPYDIHSYVEVAPLLASAGYRGVVPYLRGSWTTRFFS